MVEDRRNHSYDLAPGVALDRRPLPMDIPEGHIGLVIEIENTYELYDRVTTYDQRGLAAKQ